MLFSRLALAIALVANCGQLVLALPVDAAAGNPLVAPGHEFNANEAKAATDAWFAAKDQRDTAAYQAKLRGEAEGDGYIVIEIKDADFAKFGITESRQELAARYNSSSVHSEQAGFVREATTHAIPTGEVCCDGPSQSRRGCSFTTQICLQTRSGSQVQMRARANLLQTPMITGTWGLTFNGAVVARVTAECSRSFSVEEAKENILVSVAGVASAKLAMGYAMSFDGQVHGSAQVSAPVTFRLNGNNPGASSATVGVPEVDFLLGASATVSAQVDMGLEASFLEVAEAQIRAAATAGAGVSWTSASGISISNPALRFDITAEAAIGIPDFSMPVGCASLSLSDVIGALPSISVEHTLFSRSLTGYARGDRIYFKDTSTRDGMKLLANHTAW